MNRFSSFSRIKKIWVKRGSKKILFFAEIIEDPLKNISSTQLSKIIEDIRILLMNNWGDFGVNFIQNHVLSSDLLLLLRDINDDVVGTASISKKEIIGKEINYFKLTVVDKKYESLKLSFEMNYLLIKKIIIESFLKGKFELEFMLITPNMKVLGSLANMSDFIYPDPYAFDPRTKKIPSADEETWKMTECLIRNSDAPDRPISREGNVLEESYREMPHLIYKRNKAPKYLDDIVNDFGESYLEYSKETGKEFVVRVKFNLSNIILSLLKR